MSVSFENLSGVTVHFRVKYLTFAKNTFHIMDFSFERLAVWQKSRLLVKNIYANTNGFPEREKFGLTDQLRRAAVSISSNLAEGSGRISVKEKIHFCEISYGSLMEVMCQLILSKDLGLITDATINETRPMIEDIGNMLSAYRRALFKATHYPQ